MDDMTPEQIKKMIAMLQSMLPEDESEPEISKNKENTSNNTIRTINRKPQPSTVNKFDQMMEASLHKSDIEIDKKLAKYDPTPRLRKFNFIKVTCRVCGKSEDISPSLLSDTPDRYKCNKCSRSAG